MMIDKKIFFIVFIFFINQTLSYAEIKFGKERQTINKNKSSKEVKKKSAHKIKRKKIQQFHVEGYAGSNYVRFILEITDKKLVTGRMIQGDGTDRYVNGEIIREVMHLYDLNGEHFSILFPN